MVEKVRDSNWMAGSAGTVLLSRMEGKTYCRWGSGFAVGIQNTD
jgi:hypothetical protein